MARKFRCLVVLSIAISICGMAAAQSPSKVLSLANKAHGGEKALKAISSRQRTGRITRLSDQAAGKYSSSSSTGGQYVESFDLEGFEYAMGHNGRSGWARDSRNGLRTLTGDAAVDFQAEALFRSSLWLRAKEEKAKVSAAPQEKIDGRPVNVIYLTTAKGVRMKLSFDAVTRLLIREEIPFGDGQRTFTFGGYRAVSGVMTPFSIRAELAGEAYEIMLDAVTYDGRFDRAAFDFPRLTGEPLPDITKLLADIRANADKLDSILDNYSYTETRIERDLDKAGNFIEKSSEKVELSFYKGYRITRVIEKNGRALSAAEQDREDRDVQQRVAEIEKRIEEKERRQQAAARETGSDSTGQPNGEGQRITIADALKGSILTNPRRERFGGRDVIVFDYEPDPAFKAQTRNERLFSLCTGAIWVDPARSQAVRLEATLTKSAGNFFAKAKRGATFTLENTLVNDEVWLPSRGDIDLRVKILFAGIDINYLVLYGGYRRFQTEVKDVKVGDTPKP